MTDFQTQATRRPQATLSLDLDNLWCYQRSFDIAAWRDYPSFLDLAVPRILAVLDRLDLRLTVFIIGRDVVQAKDRGLFAEIARRGHEVANHSFEHELALHHWPRARIREEIVRAGAVIEEATGQSPRGFRGPAYGLSTDLLEVLIDLGYDYDASSYPNSLGLAARLYHRRQLSRLGGEATVGEGLYGGWRDCRMPLKPYHWSLPEGGLTEVPVTTLPLLRLPFHGTYLNFLADRSAGLGRWYFRAALALCRLRGVPPSLLLHATDFLGSDDLADFTYIPGMQRRRAEKVAFMTEVLDAYRQAFEVQPIGAFVDDICAAAPLPRRVPELAA